MALSIERNIPLAPKTTLGIGGAATHFVCVSTEDDLRAAYVFARDHDLRTVILGGGSNVLIPDTGIDALVIHPQFSEIVFEEKEGEVYVTAGAGVIFDDLVGLTVQKGLWGLENLSGIPGSVGAVPIQNVGAYGVEAEDVVHAVTVYDPHDDSMHDLDVPSCAFTYRDSVFKHKAGSHYVVVRVTFKLSIKPNRNVTYKDLATHFGNTAEPSLTEIREAVLSIRNNKFPDWHRIGTAGSFFKNPIISAPAYELLSAQYPGIPGYPYDGKIKVPLGWILDKILNLRGYRVESVGLYEKQALVLVNYGGGTEASVIAFSDAIIQKIFDATKINVEREVIVLQ